MIDPDGDEASAKLAIARPGPGSGCVPSDLISREAAVAAMTERERFEAWAVSENFPLKADPDLYCYRTSIAWTAWQAALSPEAEALAEARGARGAWRDEEQLAKAIESRQVILRNVDGGTNIGTVTPADAAMLARIALAGPKDGAR